MRKMLDQYLRQFCQYPKLLCTPKTTRDGGRVYRRWRVDGVRARWSDKFAFSAQLGRKSSARRARSTHNSPARRGKLWCARVAIDFIIGKKVAKKTVRRICGSRGITSLSKVTSRKIPEGKSMQKRRRRLSREADRVKWLLLLFTTSGISTSD